MPDQPIGVGIIKLSDGSILQLKVFIIDVKEAGFSPFGGVYFDVRIIAGVTTESVPESLKELVKDKPVFTPWPELPMEGWEFVDIVEQKPAEALTTVKSSKGLFEVKVVAEATMVAKNTLYRSLANEPLYWVYWIYKPSWRPIKG
ncbi:MAG: hypothetical protein RQ853_06795 [Acidianus sp.]|jgi:hypothetical protein|nr:hypothetical protein [Acidianus sp.]